MNVPITKYRRASEGSTGKVAPSTAANSTVAPSRTAQVGKVGGSPVETPCSCGHAHAHAPSVATAAAGGSVQISGRGLRLIRDGRTILDGIDIDIGPSEIVTLIGPNGAGKTSLVRLLLKLEPPTEGRVTHAPQTRIGYVPQRLHIDRAMPLTVARFLTLGQPASEAAVAATLAEVGAVHVLDSQLSRLSGGELQRVVMARALLRNPTLLVLDEPLRGVDTAGEAELYGLIKHLSEERGLGVLLVSHDLHVVMAASDRVVCLNHHVCCSGVPEAVAMHPEYGRLFGAEAARALAIYRHHHDHAHDLCGAKVPATSADAKEGGGSDKVVGHHEERN